MDRSKDQTKSKTQNRKKPTLKKRSPSKLDRQNDDIEDEDYHMNEEVVMDEDIDLKQEEDVMAEGEMEIDEEDNSPVKKRKRSSSNIEVGMDLEDVDEGDEMEIPYLDFSDLKLRENHTSKSLWVLPDGRVFMETFAPHYREVYDFMISIAHPLCRTRLMHQYKINHGSLYAATSLGLETDLILKSLDKYSKVDLPQSVVEYITTYTGKFGKATVVLKRNHYFVESPHLHVLEILRKDEEISNASKSEIVKVTEELPLNEFDFPTELDYEEISKKAQKVNSMDIDFEIMEENQNQKKLEDDVGGSGAMTLNTDSVDFEEETFEDFNPTNSSQNETKKRIVYSFEIDSSKFETVKRRCVELDYPLLEEYDFASDTVNENIKIHLKSTTMMRRYQEKCLSKLFSHGRVKSGIISLACGAGKSLVGVVASSTCKKRTLVLCTSTVSVQQWIHQFLLWSNIHHHNVVGFTSGGSNKTRINSEADLGGVLVTTYNMLSHSNRRSGYSAHVVGLVEQVEWGMVILDEVHVVPANTFRSVISKVKSHCKLGLSATLVREDDLIEHLLYLIGPKLYEANWLDLSRAGHIANVCCAEVWCPMTAEFYKEYVTAESRRGRSLYIMNPNKIRTCEHLINFHEARNDKILVFSDDVFALKTYANLLEKPFIYGSTPNSERMQLLSAFQYNSNAKTLFISKIGDNSIDLPEATVLIQVSSHYGSRRQEAQRLGRILRPKSRTLAGRKFDAYFYSLVSQDTKESYYSAKRQQFLIEQGYAFKIFKPMHNKPDISVMATKDSQITLLRKVLAADIETLREMEDTLEAERLTGIIQQMTKGNSNNQMENVAELETLEQSQQNASSQYPTYSYTRMEVGASALTGAAGLEYDEIQQLLED